MFIHIQGASLLPGDLIAVVKLDDPDKVIYIYMNIYMYVYICFYVSICLYIHTYLYVNIYIHKYTSDCK
jgi:hypothetical protein